MQSFLSIAQPICLVIFVYATMVGVGMTTTMGQIFSAFKHPRPLILALIFNMVAAPLIASIVANLMAGSIGDSAQTVIIAAVLINLFAGAPAGIKNVQIAGGDNVLGVALLGVLSLAVVLVTPFTASLFLPGDVSVPIINILLTLVVLVIIPLGIGLLIRTKKPGWVKKIGHPLGEISTIFMIAVMLLFLVPNIPSIIQSGWYVLFIFLIIFALNFIVSYFCTFGPVIEKKTVSMVSMCKNFGVALSVAGTAFASYNLTPMLMTYAIILLIGGLPVALILKHFGGVSGQNAPSEKQGGA